MEKREQIKPKKHGVIWEFLFGKWTWKKIVLWLLICAALRFAVRAIFILIGG